MATAPGASEPLQAKFVGAPASMVQAIFAEVRVVFPLFLSNTVIFWEPAGPDTGLVIPLMAASVPAAEIPSRTRGRAVVRVNVPESAIVPLELAAPFVTVVIVLQRKPVSVQSVGLISSVITCRFCVPFQVKDGVAVLKGNVSTPAATGIENVVVSYTRVAPVISVEIPGPRQSL